MDLLNVSRVGLEDGVEYSGVCRVTVGEMKRRISDFVRMVDCKVDVAKIYYNGSHFSAFPEGGSKDKFPDLINALVKNNTLS